MSDCDPDIRLSGSAFTYLLYIAAVWQQIAGF